MNKRSYEDYLKDILDSIYAIEIFINGMTKKEFTDDLKTICNKKDHRNYWRDSKKNSEFNHG